METLQKRVALISSLAGLVVALINIYTKIPATYLHVPSLLLSILLLLPIAIVSTLWLRDIIRQPSRLHRPDLLPTDVQTLAQLLGRKDDLPRLMTLCRQYREVHLVGESGVGKSSLLKVGLYTILRSDDLFHPIYTDTWGDDWEQGPRSSLTVALWLSLSADDRNRLGLTSIPPHRQLATQLRRVRQELHKTPLVIFDQFDDYLVRHRSQLLSLQHRTWLTADQLVSSNAFWKDIARLLEQDSIHVIFVTHLGEADGLNTVRFGPPEVYRLERLDADFIRPLLSRLTEEGVASNPERGWTSLQERLVDDLAHRGWVLPIQMRVVLQGLSTLPELTIRAYNRVGGGRGIEAALIEKHLVAAARVGELESRRLLALLLTMIQTDRDEPESAFVDMPSTRDDQTQPPGGSLGLVKAITYLLDQNVLEKKVDPSTGHESISLYHPYLCRGVREAERRSNKWRVYLRDHFALFERAKGRLWQRWCSLLSPGAQLLLWVQRAARRVRFDEMRSYVLASTLRFIPFLLAPVVLLGIADNGVDFPGAQIGRDWIDSHRLSIFRPYHSVTAIKAKAHKLRTDLLGVILHRRSGDGWIQWQAQPGAHDYWNQAQALCVLLNVAEASTIDPSVLSLSLASLYNPQGRINVNAISYGWLPNEGADYTRSEALLWAECALASAPLRMRESAPSMLSDWLVFTETSLRLYGPAATGSGGWNIFPNQIDLHESGTYVSGLALLALIRKHAARIGVSAMWTEYDLRSFEQTAQWLIANYDWHPAPSNDNPLALAGWKDGTGLQSVSPALTLWIYCILLEGEEEMGLALPTKLLENIRHQLEDGLVSIDTTESTKTRYKISFRNHRGVYSNDERITEFLAYPWAIACSARWLRRERLHQNTNASSLVSRRLEKLVLDLGEKAVHDAQNDLTFKSSELLFGLGFVDRL
jgi:hypothetical protein